MVAAPASEQARKTVTIVFADLQGSTSLQEGMDPESVRSLMGRYYAAMRLAVDAHGGKVVKFVGDGAMAVFGVPEVAEDDAVRALRAAVAMHTAARQLDLPLRIGVNTGEVVVDAEDADVLGDAVNVAARLEQAASGGEVLVGEETWRLTRHAARFEEVPALVLRGRAETVGAHRLVALVEDEEAASVPFVGRGDELASLRAVFDDVVVTGQPRIATVIGSPGVGKSRLVDELRAVVANDAFALLGRCDPTGGATFAPVAELLDRLEPLDELLHDDPERERLLQAVAGLASSGAQATPEETFWAVRRVLESAAKARPVVAVLDDVHWAEPLLLDLVEHLVEWLRAPVLLVAVARPELRELRPSIAEGPGRSIALEGLGRDATELLVRELLGTAAAPGLLLDRLVAASDGNPLFVRELVRMLVDDGVLRQEGGEWTLAVDAGEVEVPPTIQSLLASRLDRLRRAERIVLERASVIGAEVYRGALAEVLPPELRPELDAILESLRRKELLEPAGTYWIDERVLRFHHALIREAAYRRLLKESRAGLHGRVAAWLVAKTGGGAEHDESIGYHLEQAQANLRSLGPLDDDGRALAADAAARLGAAARRALDRDDLLAAAGLAGRALGCLDAEDRARADVLLTRCEALLGAGDVAAAAPDIDELTRLGAGSRRIEAWATCFTVQHTAMVDPRSLGDAEPRLIEAASILDGAGDAAGAAKAHRVHASLLARLGRVADCEAALDRALGAARAAGDRRQTTSVLGAAPLAALWGPSPVPRAGGRCLDVVRLVRITTGAPAVEATSIRCQAVLEAFRGRADAARSLIGTARSIAADLGLRHALLEVELFAGIVELCVGDSVAAAEHLRVAQDGFTAMGVTVDAAQAAALRGRAALALGDVDEALDHVATSEALGGQDLKTSIAWRAVNAEVLAARGEVEEAIRLAEVAVALAAPTDALVDHADALAALAAVHEAAGDRAVAARVASEARTLYEQKGATALATRLGATTEPGETFAGTQRTNVALHNAAADGARRGFDALLAGSVDDFIALWADDGVLEDRRPMLQMRFVGRRELAEAGRAFAGLHVPTVDLEVLAIRGDNLALVKAVLGGGGSFEEEVLALHRANADGLCDLVMVLSAADLALALEELDRLYLLQQRDDVPAIERRVLESIVPVNRGEWDGLRALAADGYTFVDHRLDKYAEGNTLDVLVRTLASAVEVNPELLHIVNFLDTRGHFTLVSTTAVLQLPGGTPYHRSSFWVSGLDAASGLLDRFELFDAEQIDTAWARFRDLTGGALPDLSNAASAVHAQVQLATVAGHIDDVLHLLAPGVVREDRRPGLRAWSEGQAAYVENQRAMAPMVDEVEFLVLAVRGEHLALVEVRLFGRFEASVVRVVRADERGRLELSITYETADLALALEELDRLYIEQEGDRLSRAEVVSMEMVQALNRRDWDAMRAGIVDDLTFVDHRLAGYGEARGADYYMAFFRSQAEVEPNFVMIGSVIAAGDRCALMRSVAVIRGLAGGRYSRISVLVGTVTPDGRIDRFEGFDEEQVEAARARYDELSSTDDELSNAAARLYERVMRAGLAGHTDDIADLVAPDVVREDRRPGLGGRSVGKAENLENLRNVGRLGRDITDLDVRVLAVRGDRLALVATQWSGSFEVSLVSIVGLNADGLGELVIDFDPAQLLVAAAEMDLRYANGEGAEHADVIRLLVATVTAHNERRWDDVRSCYADDLVAVDHRPGGFGETRGADEHVERHKAMVEVAPDYRLIVPRLFAVDRRGALGEWSSMASSAGGGAYEMSRLLVNKIAPSGRLERVEYFDVGQIDLARQRYGELLSPDDSDNLAMQMSRRWFPALVADDWDTVTGLLEPELVLDDRRPMFMNRMEGLDTILEWYRATASLGLTDVVIEPLVQRGDHLALLRRTWVAQDLEMTSLVLVEVDDEGRGVYSCIWDDDDVDAAMAELDERSG